MPARNREHLITASIESALAQTFRDFELLVVDDGSTDGTLRVVRARAADEPRIRIIEGPQQGMSAAMNRGVRAARGQYYARLDSDDLWDPRFLELTVAAMDATPQAGVVYPCARTFTDDGRVPQADRGRPMVFPDRPFHSMLLGDYASGAALVRVECHGRIGGFDESLPLWEDWDFWVRLSRHYDLRFIDVVLAHLRVHAANVSADASRWASRVRVLDKVFASGEPLPEAAAGLRGRAYSNVYCEIGLAHWQAGAYRRAVGWFRKGIAAHDEPVRAALRLAYALCLQHLGRVPYFWALHGRLSRARRALGL